MILRRFLINARKADWFAVILDLFVVILGILIAFQIDRWYESQQTESRVLAHLKALDADFSKNRDRLIAALGYANSQVEATLTLRAEIRKPEPELSVAKLNRLYGQASGLPTFEAVDFAYQNLINSGELSDLKNLALKKELADFYASYELTKVIQATQELQYVNLVQPYTIENLDYAASGRPGSAGKSERQALEPLIDPGLILEAMKTKDFENLLVAQWERAVDIKSNYAELLEAVQRIQTMLQIYD